MFTVFGNITSTRTKVRVLVKVLELSKGVSVSTEIWRSKSKTDIKKSYSVTRNSIGIGSQQWTR